MSLWMISSMSVLSVIFLGLSYFPQIIRLYRTKNAEGISPSFWYILDVSLLLLFILAWDTYLTTGKATMLIAQAVNLVLALVVTGQVIFYKRKE